MTFEFALEKILGYLKDNQGATNRALTELVEGDMILFEKIREHLIFNDLAEDKKGVGLVYLKKDSPDRTLISENEKLKVAFEAEPKETSEQSYRIFISYGRKDAEDLANRIAVDLRVLGHDVWIDKEQIKTGASWEEQIEEAILSHDVFISLLTPHAVRRPDGVCLDEISMARFHNRKIVPVMVVQCRPPLSIYRLDWVDFQDWSQDQNYKRSFSRIINSLHGQVNVEGSYSDIFSRLKPLDFGVDISRMTKDFTGRKWLFDEFDYWLKQSASKVLVITGDPGIGKSAIMAQLASRHPQVMAFHFCISSLADSLNPDVFVKSVASQLATQIKEYNEAIKQLNFEQLTRLDSGSLFRRLIADPLKSINLDEQVVILVDALDESWTDTSNNIVRVLHDRIEDLPEQVKVMVSSRKIPDILDLLSKYKPHEIDPVCLENIHDITDYLYKKFRELNSAGKIKSTEPQIKFIQDLIIRKSEGNFLYVKQFIYGLETGRIDINNAATFPDGLIGIYVSFFDRIFSGNESWDAFRPLLEVITCLKKPFTVKELSPIVQLSEFEIRRRMQTLSAFFPERNGCFYPYHKSVTDWLTGSAGRGRKYLLDVEKGRKVISDYLLERYSQKDYDAYLLTYLPYHLIESERYHELIELLLDFDFLIQKCSHKMIYELIKDYHAAFTVLPEVRDIKREEREYLNSMTEYTHKMVLNPESILNKTIKMESLTPWTEQQIDNEIERIKTTPANKDILRIYRQFLDSQSHLLYRYGNIEGYLLQQAYNYAGSGPFADRVDEYLKKDNRIKLLFVPEQREEFNPFNPCIRILQEHSERVLGVSITSDGKFAATGSNDNSLKFWDLRSGECLKTIRPNLDYIGTLDATPDLNLIATSGGRMDTKIQLWNYKDLEPRGKLYGHSCRITDLKITPDGQYVVSQSLDENVRIWRTNDCQCIVDFKKDMDDIDFLDITLDNKVWLTEGYGKAIFLFDIPDEKRIQTFKGIDGLGYPVRISMDKKILYSPDNIDGRTIKLWELNSGHLLKTLQGHEYPVNCLEVTHDGKFLVSAGTDKTIKVWSLNNYACIKTVEGHVGSIISMKITPDLKYIISGAGGLYNDNTVRIWDIYKSKLPLEEYGLYRNINHLSFLTTGNYILNTTRKVIQLRDPETGRIKRELAGHKAHIKQVVADKEGRRIFSAGLDKTIRIWDIASGKCIANLEGHTDGILDISLSRDQKKLVSCGWDKQIIEWNLESNQKMRSYKGHDTPVIYNSYYTDEKQLLSMSTDNSLKIWDTTSGICLNTLQIPENITSGIIMDSKSHIFLGCMDGSVYHWDVQRKELLMIFTGHSGLVNSIELLDEERTLFSGSSDCTIRQWDLTTGECIRVFIGHLGEVVFIRRIPGQKKILTGSRDHTLRLWDIYSGKCVAVLTTNLQITSLAPVQEDGRFAYGTMQGEFKVVELSGL
jgi:WD40 repeat protein